LPGASADEIAVVYNGCDHVMQVRPDEGQLAALSLKPRRYVLALANTQKHKNIGVLLKTFAGAELRDVELVLFGGATQADFENLGHIVPPNVQFAGRITDLELVGLMVNAGALPEVCGKAALYADPFSLDAWRLNILTALDAEAVRQSLISAGRRQAGGFTWKRAARNLCEAVKTISR